MVLCQGLSWSGFETTGPVGFHSSPDDCIRSFRQCRMWLRLHCGCAHAVEVAAGRSAVSLSGPRSAFGQLGWCRNRCPGARAAPTLFGPRRTGFLLTPEEIETVDLPRAMVGGYDRRSTDDVLRRIAWDMRALIQERLLLEEEMQRLKSELSRSERESAAVIATQAEAQEMQETARRDSELMLRNAREQAERIVTAAERETAERVEALRRVEKVHGLVRVELRTLLTTLLEALSAPSDSVRESLRDPKLTEDLQRITRAAVAASAPITAA